MLLIGRGLDGRTSETIMSEARLFGVTDRITIRESVPDGELARALRSSKVSLILSGNEGACVAIAESLFADVPVGVLADAIIGSKAFINEETGCLLDRQRLSEELSEFIARSDRYSPRRWALNSGISCRQSSRILNDAVRSKALHGAKNGRPISSLINGGRTPSTSARKMPTGSAVELTNNSRSDLAFPSDWAISHPCRASK